MDEYLKEVGVGLVGRMMAKNLKPRLIISEDEQGQWTLRTETTLRTMNFQFRPGEEYEETTADGRQLTVERTMCSSIESLSLFPIRVSFDSRMANGFKRCWRRKREKNPSSHVGSMKVINNKLFDENSFSLTLSDFHFFCLDSRVWKIASSSNVQPCFRRVTEVHFSILIPDRKKCHSFLMDSFHFDTGWKIIGSDARLSLSCGNSFDSNRSRQCLISNSLLSSTTFSRGQMNNRDRLSSFLRRHRRKGFDIGNLHTRRSLNVC